MFRDAFGTLPWLVLAMARMTSAACECGYSLNKTSDGSSAVFTDLMENDFLHTDTDNLTDFGWRPQVYNMTAKEARGPFGKQFLADNIVLNPLKDKFSWAGEAEHGGDAGLSLWVRGDHSHGFVSGAEMASVREDALYGSFRVGMKLASSNSGTCGAFFWFFNNSQEIDMEFLSKQFNESKNSMNLVLQTPMSVVHGYDAANTSEFKVAALPFRPDEKVHEYRFDWTPDKISFYVDGQWLYDMTTMIPTQGGRFFLNHWSNGDPLWSAGPPSQDTAMTVSYIKAYFNSTDDHRNTAFKQRCPAYNTSSICEIPAQTTAPDPAGSNGNVTAKTYFFSLDSNRAPGQIVFKTTNSKSSATRLLGSSAPLFAYVPVLLAFLGWAYVV